MFVSVLTALFIFVSFVATGFAVVAFKSVEGIVRVSKTILPWFLILVFWILAWPLGRSTADDYAADFCVPVILGNFHIHDRGNCLWNPSRDRWSVFIPRVLLHFHQVERWKETRLDRSTWKQIEAYDGPESVNPSKAKASNGFNSD